MTFSMIDNVRGLLVFGGMEGIQNLNGMQEQAGSVHSQQQLLSLSPSRSRMRLDSHIKSSLAHLQGRADKKYIYLKVHNSFVDQKNANCQRLLDLLREQFDTKADFRYFKETKELLADNYDDNQLHYIIVPEKELSWAETFAKQEREESNNRKKIYVYGLLKRSVALEKTKSRSKKKIDRATDFVQYYSVDDEEYPEQIVRTVAGHLEARLQQEGAHTKAWAVTNKFAGKSVKRRTLHFYYEPRMEKELTGLYQAYRKKARSSWIQIYKYETFEDVLRKIRERSVAFSKEVETARQVTSRLLKSTSELEPASARSVLPDTTSQLNSSILSSSIRAINKLDQNDVNIIIAHGQHPEMQKFRALVRAQKYGNWFLWEISEDASDFFQQLKEFLNEEVKSNEQRDAEEYQRIVHSRSLIILALDTDSNTIDMFQAQQNVLHNMQLLLYKDPDEFSILLREGVQSSDDFVIAVVPGGFKSFATEYARVIAEFDAKYRNVDCVENYKFISNANGRHVSNIASSNLLGTQSNLTYFEDNAYLETLMRDRDRHFHPIQGLKGHNVYLLVNESVQHLLEGIRDYVASSPRLHISTYIDKQFLTRQIQTITLKDSALIVTDDSTLREAQLVAKKFDQVSILNITDRENAKEEVKVIISAKKDKVYQLIKTIPETAENLDSQIYEEGTPDESYQRTNRIMPKRITFRPADTISIRLPADLKDEESHKMQVRLQKHFNKEIKIEYYKDPLDVRLANKLEEPLAFVIWTDKADTKEGHVKRREELEYFKELAQNQAEELREEFIIYSQQPKLYAPLTQLPAFTRFKFVSSRWQRIEEYIIGAYNHFLHPEDPQDFIYSDQMIRVFFNDKDKASRDLIAAVSKRRNDDELNAANHVQFHLMDDLQPTLQEQSPYHKYYIVLNEDSQATRHSRADLTRILNEYPHVYARFLLIHQDSAKKMQAQDNRVRRVFPSEAQAGEWLSNITVKLAEVDFVMPHVVIDGSCIEYYYFLDKYSQLTRRFSFAYCPNKQAVKQQLLQRKDSPNQHLWIIVKDAKAIAEYTRLLERADNFKNVRFIVESGDALPAAVKGQVVFKNESRKEIQKFLLNIYRRDKAVFFPSSVRITGKPVLAIMQGTNGRTIPINKQERANWVDILKAEVIFLKDLPALSDVLRQRPNDMVYVVYPSIHEKELTNLCASNKNLRRVVLAPYPEYDPRKLRTNFVDNNNKIYIGTYPAEVTDYLRFLRYNIRRSEEMLERRITKELIEVNVQKEQALTEQQAAYLTAKNDSIILSRNGFEKKELPQLLSRAGKFSYLQVMVGDEQVGKAVAEYNQKNRQDVQFINAKASPLLYADSPNCPLQTNEREQLLTFLYNMPENRYLKAIQNRGRFLLYLNPNEPSIYPYVSDLREICIRRPTIQVRHYANIASVNSELKEPGVILINGQSEKEYLQKVKPLSNISYMITNEEYSPEKNYASYGNKCFITRRQKEFESFMNQLATEYDPGLAPIALTLDNANALLASIHSHASAPFPPTLPFLRTNPPFRPLPPRQIEELSPVELKAGVIDSSPPTLLNIDFPAADVPSLPLGFEVLRKIKDSAVRGESQILRVSLDSPPSQGWFNIKSEPDSFSGLPGVIPIPSPVVLRLKLAILHPSTKEFQAIAQMLKRNLEPDQFTLTLIEFKSEHQLEEYSKNNGQRLNGYDKIVVFLSQVYRKYDPTLKLMKAKLNGRMEYFFFDDNFHLHNHAALAHHLRPYRIRPYALPYTAPPPKHLLSAHNVLILVPNKLLRKYEGLKAGHVQVAGYQNEADVVGQLHRQGWFVVLVCQREDYHQLKLHAKASPRCLLVVDTSNELPQDQLYLYRVPTYTLYYGSNAPEYLRKILPARAPSGSIEALKFLFYSPAEEDLAFLQDYCEYQRVRFLDYRDLYRLLMFDLKGRSNWLIKQSPGRPEIVPLHPKVFLQPKPYMKDFKNNFAEQGYLNNEHLIRPSAIIVHQYADLPEVYYSDEKELGRLLEKQEAPSVVLWDVGNRRVGALRGRVGRWHNWVGLTNHGQRWINPEGELPEVTDDRLLRKQDMFANMFNNRVFDEFNDMQYYYLSNKAHVDHTRNIYFRTKEQLLATYNENPNLLMAVFVQAKDVNHIPQVLLKEGAEPSGRVKLILLNTEFVDDYDTLYIKFNEIDPVIKHINAVEAAGRIDFIVYNESDGEKTRQTLVQRRKLKNFENKPYSNFIEVDQIARNIKGRYKKVYVICFPDEKQEIESTFESYAIKNKGIPNEGVEFVYIDRLSTIRPNLSHISNIREAKSKGEIERQSGNDRIQNNQVISSDHLLSPNFRSRKEQPPVKVEPKQAPLQYTESAIYTVKEEIEVVEMEYGGERGREQQEREHRRNIHMEMEEGEAEEESEGANEEEEENDERQKDRREYMQEEFQLPNTQSNVKPNKMESILASKDCIVNIDEKLKGLVPLKNIPYQVRFFSQTRPLPDSQAQPQIIISAHSSPQLVSLAQQPDNFLVVVGPAGRGLRSNINTLVIEEDELPGLIGRLEGGQDDELGIRNLEDFSKVRVVYDKDMDLESKKRLLAASEKNKKILPTIFKGVGKLKEFMQEPDSLLLLMMSYDPENLEAAAAQHDKVVVKKRKIKMIVPRKGESEVDGLETILEEEQADPQNDAIKKLTNEQVDLFLKIYQNTDGERPPVTQPDEWDGQGADVDNITKLNVHSNIRPEALFRQNQIQKIKQRLTGDLIVLVIDSAKRKQADEAVGKNNVLVQAYTNSMNLQNDIRDHKDKVTLAVIDRNMLDKIPSIKKKYPHVAFILEADGPQDDGIDQYRPYLAAQIRKMADLEKLLTDLYLDNERIRYNAESVRAASRFQMKKTSVVDVSNNQRFTVGLSNQKSKKVFLFYKDPDNTHIKSRLINNSNNINFIPYKSVADFIKLISTYNTYSSILIANGTDIPELEDFVSKKKEMIYVIRFNPPSELRDNPRVKRLFSTYKKDALQNFIISDFSRHSFNLNDAESKLKANKNAEVKRYIQKYQPNTFGTTPRFPGDFVPPKSKESTYSRKYMKSTSRSKLSSSRLGALSPKSQRNEYQ